MFGHLPLAALRTFEAAARLGSFKAAAVELNVTATAVSHQVRQLEESLGQLLFERLGRRVRLNDAGQRLQRSVHGGLLELRHGVDELRPEQREDSLTVLATPALAALWLVPRLGRFYRSHPGCRVRIQTGPYEDPRFDASLDLVIACRDDASPGLLEFPLMSEAFCAYGEPDLLARLEKQRVELIGVDWTQNGAQGLPEWHDWFAACGQPLPEQAVLRHYPDEHYALQAAISGQGLVLASSVLASDSLAHGWLQAYREEVRLPGSEYLAQCVPGRERRPALRAFLDWLRAEARSSR